MKLKVGHKHLFGIKTCFSLEKHVRPGFLIGTSHLRQKHSIFDEDTCCKVEVQEPLAIALLEASCSMSNDVKICQVFFCSRQTPFQPLNVSINSHSWPSSFFTAQNLGKQNVQTLCVVDVNVGFFWSS